MRPRPLRAVLIWVGVLCGFTIAVAAVARTYVAIVVESEAPPPEQRP